MHFAATFYRLRLLASTQTKIKAIVHDFWFFLFYNCTRWLSFLNVKKYSLWGEGVKEKLYSVYSLENDENVEISLTTVVSYMRHHISYVLDLPSSNRTLLY